MEGDEDDIFMDSFDADLVQMPGDNTMAAINGFKTPNEISNVQVDSKEKRKSKMHHPTLQHSGFMSAQKLYESRLDKENKIENDSINQKQKDKEIKESKSNPPKEEVRPKDNKTDKALVSLENVKKTETSVNESNNKQPPFKAESHTSERLEKNKENNHNEDRKANDVDNKVESVESSACELAKWGLPDSILNGYADKGIKSMFPWQVECLRSEGVMDGKNLVYSAPTSAGKSLVAEILMIKRVIETGRKALLILPFVSLAREKMFHLQHVLGDTGIRVEGFMGSISPLGGIKVADIGVATIEKANGIVNRLLEEGELDKIGCLVIDELHLLGDSSRGYLLELLLTKVRYVSLGYEDPEKSVQIVGMSATLPNLTDLSSWLQASLYTTDFRPVPLTELIKIGRTLYNTSLLPVGSVVPEIQIPNDNESMSWLSLETILAGHSILIFCPIKSWVEKLAEAVAKDLFFVGKPDPEDKDSVSCDVRQRLQNQLDGFKLGEVLEQLKRCPSGLDQTLANTLRFGVGFHHAGLTTDERDILEANFKSGVIRVLVATSTLSSGVNLPARRVILRCPMTYNGQLMEKLAYKQMVGRAGRKGVDTAGESILICKELEKSKVRDLVSGDVEPVHSCLAAGGSKLAASMKRAILEVVVSGAATSREQVERYASCTLLAAQMKNESEEGENEILKCIEFLENNEFIRIQTDDEEGSGDQRYVPSRLGMACLASSLAPDEGLLVFKELEKARKQFVLENELHIIYLIVPIYAAVSWPKLDWMGFLSMWEGLSEDMKRVGQIVGIEERWMVRAMRGTLRTTDPVQRNALAVHQRFYTALALHDLAHEVPLATVAIKFGATKGMLQSLQQAASTFAGMVTVFCARLGWNNLELLLGQFQDRLEFGVRRELIDLCRLASLDGARARILYDGGIETVAQLAAAKSDHIENILYSAEPFKSKKSDDQDPKKVKTVFISGLAPMTEADAAKLMVGEARSVLKRDLGLQAGAWLHNTQQQEEANNNAQATNTPLNSKPIPNSSNGKNRRSSSGKRLGYTRRKRRSSSDLVKQVQEASPHLAYHMGASEPVAKPAEEAASKAPNTDKDIINVETEDKSPAETLIRKSIIGNKDIFISPPEQQRPKQTEIGHDKLKPHELDVDKENQFDMSSIMENIFENEVEMVEEVDVKDDNPTNPASPELKQTKDQSKKSEEDNSPRSHHRIHCEELTLELSETDESLGNIDNTVELEDDKCVEDMTGTTVASSLVSADTIAEWDSDIFESSMQKEDDKKDVEKVESPEVFTVDDRDDEVINESCDDNKLSTKSYNRKPGTPLTYSRTKRSLKERKRHKNRRKNVLSPGDLILSDSDDVIEVESPKKKSKVTDSASDKNENKEDLTAETTEEPDNGKNELTIIDVCCDRKLFNTFVDDFKHVESFSFALAVDGCEEEERREDKNNALAVENGTLHGISFCFGDKLQAFYLCLQTSSHRDLNASCQMPELDGSITLDEKIKFLSWLSSSQRVNKSRAVSWRRQQHLLYKLTAQFPRSRLSLDDQESLAGPADPAVAAWILQPGAPQQTLNRMVLENIPHLTGLVERLGSSPGVGSVATCPYSPIAGRIRATVESILVHHLVNKLEQDLKEKGLYQNFVQVEMGIETVLLGMELTGMGIHAQEYRDTKLLLEQRCKLIEQDAYKLAGRHFTFSSPQDIIRLLYHEMRFPVNGDPKLNLKMVRPGKGGIKLSATKDILEKLALNHDLPKLILEHRRISGALTRTVNPLLTNTDATAAKMLPHQTHVARVYTSCITHTATGRISLQEPNLQNIPKDFEVELTDDLRQRALGRRSKRRSSSSNKSAVSNHLEKLLEPSQPSSTISLRNALIPAEGNLYLSADYSQLELRILAHLSQDAILKDTLKLGGDVFKSLAARVNRIEPEEVTDEQRQAAKQIVYGIIYGVGAKSLGEQLRVTEAQAEKFMDNFKSKYPGVRIFLNKCVASARRTGSVETLCGRARAIPDIQATNMHRRAAAERQAVNTRVQGSASDLVKLAMIAIDKKISAQWPHRRPYKPTRTRKATRGPWLALQLHDELIYEVPADDVIKMATIVRDSMESAMQLTIPTPVRIKVGETWGNLKLFHFPQ